MDTDPSDIECWETSPTSPSLIPGTTKEESEPSGQLRCDRNTDAEALGEEDENEQRELGLIKGSSDTSSAREGQLQAQVQGIARAVVQQLKEFMDQDLQSLSRGDKSGGRNNGASILGSSVGSTYSQGEETEAPRMPLSTLETRSPSLLSNSLGLAEDKWTKGMQKIIASIERPKQALPTFTGESRKEYGIFKQRFRQYLHEHAVEPASKLNMLIDACTGEMKDSLMRYVRLGPEEGYNEALKMLSDRLGDTHDHIDDALLDLLNGPAIKDNDVRQIKEFNNKLWNVITDLEYSGRQDEVNAYGLVLQMSRRLTGNLRQRYSSHLHKYKSTKNETKPRPCLKWLRDFMEDYMRRLMGEGSHNSDRKERNEANRDIKSKRVLDVPKGRAVGFAAAEKEPTRRSQSDSNQNSSLCYLCEKKHPLYACWRFRMMPATERWEAVKGARACYMCLGPNHTINKCNATYKTCGFEGCTQAHSRWLHRDTGTPRLEKRKESVPSCSLEAPLKRPKMDKADD